MLEIVGRNKPNRKSAERFRGIVPPLIPGFLQHAPSVPLISRDAYVEETTSRIEQLQREIGALRKELSETRGELARAREEGEQTRRFYAFLERETRTRSAAAEDMQRLVRGLKGRLDRIESKSGGNYHGFSTFESVSKRLTELGDMEKELIRSRADLKLAAGLFCASVLVWALLFFRG